MSPSFPCRCDISVCYKPDSSADWRLRKSQTSAQIQPLNPTFCSLLCLPIVTFSGALPWDSWPLVWLLSKGNILCYVIYMLWLTDTDCKGKVHRKCRFFHLRLVSWRCWGQVHMRVGNATAGNRRTGPGGVIRKLQTGLFEKPTDAVVITMCPVLSE